MACVLEMIHEEARVAIRFNGDACSFAQGQLVALLEQLPGDAHVFVDAQAAR